MASLITTKKRRDVWTCRQLTVDNYHRKTNNFWGMAKKTPPKKVWVWRNNSCGQMWLLCSRVLILHQQNTVCPQTCLSLPAGLSLPAAVSLPSYLPFLPPFLLPSFLPFPHSSSQSHAQLTDPVTQAAGGRSELRTSRRLSRCRLHGDRCGCQSCV